MISMHIALPRMVAHGDASSIRESCLTGHPLAQRCARIGTKKRRSCSQDVRYWFLASGFAKVI
jgi:hypothetical protein